MKIAVVSTYNSILGQMADILYAKSPLRINCQSNTHSALQQRHRGPVASLFLIYRLLSCMLLDGIYTWLKCAHIWQEQIIWFLYFCPTQDSSCVMAPALVFFFPFLQDSGGRGHLMEIVDSCAQLYKAGSSTAEGPSPQAALQFICLLLALVLCFSPLCCLNFKP